MNSMVFCEVQNKLLAGLKVCVVMACRLNGLVLNFYNVYIFLYLADISQYVV